MTSLSAISEYCNQYFQKFLAVLNFEKIYNPNHVSLLGYCVPCYRFLPVDLT